MDPTCPRCGHTGPPAKEYPNQPLIKCGGCQTLVDPRRGARASASSSESISLSTAGSPLSQEKADLQSFLMDVVVQPLAGGGVEVRLSSVLWVRVLVFLSNGIALAVGLRNAARPGPMGWVWSFFLGLASYYAIAWAVSTVTLTVDRAGLRSRVRPLPMPGLSPTCSYSLGEVQAVESDERVHRGNHTGGGSRYWVLVTQRRGKPSELLTGLNMGEADAGWLAARLNRALDEVRS